MRKDSGAVWIGCVSWVETVLHGIKMEALSQNITFPPPSITNISRTLQIEYEVLRNGTEANIKPMLHQLVYLINSPLAIFTRTHIYKYYFFLRWLEADVDKDDPQVYTNRWYWRDQVNRYNFIVKAGMLVESGGDIVCASASIDQLEYRLCFSCRRNFI